MDRRPHPFLLYFFILVMVLCWAFNFTIGKIGLEHIGPLALASFRIVLSGIIMVPIYLATPWRPRFGRRDLWTFAVLGFFGVAVNRGLFTVGLDYTTVGHSALILAMGPILVLLFARAQGLEALTRPKIFGMTLSAVGILVLMAESNLGFHSGTLRGDLITLLGTSGFAIYAVLAKKVAGQYDTITMNTFSNLAGALIVLPLAIREGIRLDWGSVGWEGWGAVAYMAIASSVVAYLIFYWALRYMSASRLAAFSYVHPPLAALLGILLLGERVTHNLLVGGALILIGVYLTERGPSETLPPPDTAAA